MKIKMRFYTRIRSNGCVETLCYLQTTVTKEVIRAGIARQNPLDTHSEYMGRKTALKNLLSASLLPRGMRKPIWEHFHEHYPKPGQMNIWLDEPPTKLKWHRWKEQYEFYDLDESKRQSAEKMIESGGDCGDFAYITCMNCFMNDDCVTENPTSISDEESLAMAKSYIRQLDKKRDNNA